MTFRIVRLSLAAMFVVAVVGGCTRSEFTLSPADRKVLQRVEQSKLTDAREAKVPSIRPETRFAAGRLLEAQGRYAEAAAQFRRAIEEEPKFAEAHHHLGRLHSRAGDHEGASRHLRRAVHLRPDNAAFRNDLGYQYMLQGSWSDAERELREALALRGDFLRASVNLGVCLGRQGRFEEALTQFRAALPEPDAWYNLGLMYRGQRHYAQAESAFRKALELSPELTAARTQIDQLETLARADDSHGITERLTQSSGIVEEDFAAAPFFEAVQRQAEAPQPTSGFDAAASPSEQVPQQGTPPTTVGNGLASSSDIAPGTDADSTTPRHSESMVDPSSSKSPDDDPFAAQRIQQESLAEIRAERACLEDAILDFEAAEHEAALRESKSTRGYGFRLLQEQSEFGEDDSSSSTAEWGMSWMEPMCPATNVDARRQRVESIVFDDTTADSDRSATPVDDLPIPPLDPTTLAVLHDGYDVTTDPRAVAHGLVVSAPAIGRSRRRPSLSSRVQFATYKGNDGHLDAVWYDPALQIAICPPEGCDASAPVVDDGLRQWIEDRSGKDELFSILMNEIRCLEGQRGY